MSSLETSLLPPIPPATPPPNVPVAPNSSMNGLNPSAIAGSPMIQNALAEAMRKQRMAPQPFKSILAKPKAAPTPAPAPTPPQVAPQPVTDPDAAAQGQLQAAYTAEQNFKPYQAPPRPVPDKLTGILDLIAAAFLRKSGANVGQAEGQRLQAQQDLYDKDTASKQAESDKQEQMLDKRVDVAERGLYNQQQIDVKNQQNAIRQQQIAGAQKIAKERADAYARSVANTYANDKAKLAQQAKLAAEANGIKVQGIVQHAMEVQWTNYARMQAAGMRDDTARQLAGQRMNMQLLIEKLRDAQQDKLSANRIAATQQANALRATIQEYDAIMSKGASPLAAQSAQAAADRLLTPDKNGMTPYDKAISQAQTIGVAIKPNTDLEDLGVQTDALQKQYLDDYQTNIDAGTYTGAYDPALAGGTGGGGTTININTGGAAGGANGQPSAGQVDQGGPYGTGSGEPPGINSDQGVGDLTQTVALTSQQAGQQFGVAPQILMRMIGAESSGREIDPTTGKIVTSKKGAEGIAQFMPDTAKQYGVNVNDVNSSIMGMAHYMSDLMKKFGGSPVWATAAYNAGPGNVEQAFRLKDPTKLPDETQKYLKAVYGDDVMGYLGGGAVQTANRQPQQAQHQVAAPGANTKQVATNGKVDPNDPHKKIVPPQQWAENVIQKYSTDPNYQGKSFDQVWPSMKDAMLNLKPPLGGAEIQQIGALVKPRIDKAYAASVKAQQDDQAKNVASTRYQDLINSGASPEQAQATIAREAGGISAESHQQPQAQAPQQKITMSAPAFVKQKIAEYTKLTGSLPPGAMQQITQSLIQTYKMTPQQAQSVIQIAMKPQPQQMPTAVAGIR